MAKPWPAFVTADLGDSETDHLEMTRRWRTYRDDMAALIAAGGVHRDDDGWWIDDASGELIGPDPEIERPFSDDELATAVRLDQALPDVAAALRRSRGPQKGPRKISTTIRLSPDVLDRFRATGPGWQTRVDSALREWLASHPGGSAA